MVNRTFDEDRPQRLTFARVAAPLAFVAAVTVLVLLIHRSLSTPSSANTSASPTAPAGSVAGTSTTLKSGKVKKKYYRVKNGDTLDAIAIRFHTTVDDLLRLNPKVDQYNLAPGQRLRVR